VGEAGQEKLKGSSVLVAGLGGLGSTAAYYLAGAGVGKIGLLDSGKVNECDLHRQILYATTDIGWPKTIAARDRIRVLNHLLEVVPLEEKLDGRSAPYYLQDFDFICDCTGNTDTHLLINETCHALKRPFCHGGIEGHQGQVTSIHTALGTPCYRCLHPASASSEPGLPESTEPAGILGPVAGVIGCLQAMEALKHFLELGDPLHGRVLIIDLMTAGIHEIQYEKKGDCSVCATHE
jgi:molybdopterin/thiamine biosynthesis adenylyltransferase